jgi:hypothetical protein
LITTASQILFAENANFMHIKYPVSCSCGTLLAFHKTLSAITTNPPVGAFACYMIADILVMKLSQRLAPLTTHVAFC